MQALGFIETKGLIAAIESADAMLKASNVKLLEKQYVGGGLVYISVTGDVGAVKAAVEAGQAVVKQIDENLLISHHVIPRPHGEVQNIILTEKKEFNEEIEIEEEKNQHIEVDKIIIETKEDINQGSIKGKESLDKAVLNYGIEKIIQVLNSFKVVRLRNLARQYKEFGIMGRGISKADKKMLIEEFRKYYENSLSI
ncbi:microcompartment protein CcmL/EutN [Acetoanaerobium pronyense]|uniref:Microcompartment protein CcmL/EutN n=1 Tax=Acetoanaerobium pronyense TaxID=1482736 RepID=A0ABS4KH45_9FIRM|nr:BMC domain-containing protein [Acetoanaerobium pronyense]MBP2027093.1 microcompartment protein CcmL/EutN [Acetoanaerobium pronyense]